VRSCDRDGCWLANRIIFVCEAWQIVTNWIPYKHDVIPFLAGNLAALSMRIVRIFEAVTECACVCVCLCVF
jgi:hypothetical protein